MNNNYEDHASCSLKCIDPEKIKDFNRHIEKYKDSLTNGSGIISEKNVMKFYFYLNSSLYFSKSLYPYQVIDDSDCMMAFIKYFSDKRTEKTYKSSLGNNIWAHCIFKNLALNFVKDHSDYSYIEDNMGNCGLIFTKKNISLNADKVGVLNVGIPNSNDNKEDTYQIKYYDADDISIVNISVPKDKYKDTDLVSIPYMLYKDGYITKYIANNLCSICLVDDSMKKTKRSRNSHLDNTEAIGKALSKYNTFKKTIKSNTNINKPAYEPFSKYTGSLKETNKTDTDGDSHDYKSLNMTSDDRYIKIPVTPKDPKDELLILANAIAKRLDYIYKNERATMSIEKYPSKKGNSTRPYDININIYSSYNESL